jgi:hypothetical protein
LSNLIFGIRPSSIPIKKLCIDGVEVHRTD